MIKKMLLVFLCLSLFLSIPGCKKKLPTSPDIPDFTTGSIQVNSTPTGAQVFLDGSNTGQTTNCTLTDIFPGSHTVMLVMEGYEDEQMSVSVTAGQTATVSVTLTKPTITVIELPPSTVWTTGKEVEIKWETSGSGSSQGVVSTGAGLNPSINQGGRALSRFQRRAFQERRFLRNSIKERRRAEDIDLSGNLGMLSSNTSKSQDVSGEISSSVKKGDIGHKRTEDIENIKRNSRVGRVNIPVAPQVSTKKFTRSGDIRVLGLSYAKIELYKGSTFNQTIVSSTENDGSYMWTVNPSLEDGTDYKIRISNPNDSTSYGESDAFTIEEESITETIYIKCDKDVFVSSAHPDNNFDYANQNFMGTFLSLSPDISSISFGETRIYVYFDLSSIPSNVTIDEAVIIMKPKSDPAVTNNSTVCGALLLSKVNFGTLSTYWSESSLTWNSSLNTLVTNNSNSGWLFNIPFASSELRASVKLDIQGYSNGNTNITTNYNGWVIRSYSTLATDFKLFWSSDCDSSSYFPTLKVTYH